MKKDGGVVKNNPFGKVLPILMIVVVMFTIFVFASTDKKGNVKKVTPGTTQKTQMTDKAYDTSFTGVITGIDEERKEIIIYNIKFENKLVLTYTGGTDFRNKYKKVVSISQMHIGQIVEAGYIRKSMKLTTLHESDKCWEYKNLSNFSIENSANTFFINGKKYKYGPDLCVSMDGVIIDKDKIIQGDEITARGIGNKVYSVAVTRGHGSLEFDNYEELLGGLVMVGNYDAIEITENMKIDIAEGKYDVWFVNGKLKGEKTVMISRNETTKVDLGDIYLEPTDTALVNFRINPSNSILYIDGVARKYDNPVELEYGVYKVDVELYGYQSYTGKLKVEQSTVTFAVNLRPEEEDEPSKEPENNEAANPSDPAGQTTTKPQEEPANQETSKPQEEPTSQTTTKPSQYETTQPTVPPVGGQTVPPVGEPTVPPVTQESNKPAYKPTNQALGQPTYSSDATQFADGSGGVG